MFDGIVRTLGDVRYIPDLKKNLISLGTLDSIDCSISIKGGVMKVSKGAMVIMKGQKIGNLYKLIGNTVIGGASVSTHVGSSNDNSELWHKRLGHLSEGGTTVVVALVAIGADDVFFNHWQLLLLKRNVIELDVICVRMQKLLQGKDSLHAKLMTL
ncbi:hypothetical protein RJ640_009534 [Escallonia rubra]|uniref:Retrovirus-related Pol polyprotein from transposon TNT 1-94 n=1 Tax=Escallonia rubra TaxID=112253 RepID=A0AA88QU10_9ASTE|nr:hypothetical protein RJ640_009534 [Escallonia rubra]